MSSEAMKWAVELAPPMPAQLVATLTALAYHADKKGRGAYPSVPRLAALTCKAERSIRRDLRELEHLKLIRKGDQSEASNLPADKRPEVYDLAVEMTVPKGRAGDDDRTWTSARTLASARARGVEARKAKKASSEHESKHGRPDVDVRGDVDVRPDVGVPSDRTSTSAKPTTEVTTGSVYARARGTRGASSTSSPPPRDYAMDTFGSLWLIYPRQKEIESAKRAWREAIDRGADPRQMLDAATAYANECAERETRFIKYPATWLDKGCYLDAPDPEPPAGQSPNSFKPWGNPEDQNAYHEDPNQ